METLTTDGKQQVVQELVGTLQEIIEIKVQKETVENLIALLIEKDRFTKLSYTMVPVLDDGRVIVTDDGKYFEKTIARGNTLKTYLLASSIEHTPNSSCDATTFFAEFDEQTAQLRIKIQSPLTFTTFPELGTVAQSQKVEEITFSKKGDILSSNVVDTKCSESSTRELDPREVRQVLNRVYQEIALSYVA